MHTRTTSSRGFTLIELLVVITIIGILATGAIATYTTQIQKARDTTRVEDVKAIQAGLDQFYSDKNMYPNPTVTDTSDDMHFDKIAIYMSNSRIPMDTKSGQPCNGDPTGTACDYIYASISDENGIELGAYEMSIGFENSGNRTSKAINDKDGGNDANRLEMGKRVSLIDTSCERGQTDTIPSSYPASSVTTVCGSTNSATGAILIAGIVAPTPATPAP